MVLVETPKCLIFLGYAFLRSDFKAFNILIWRCFYELAPKVITPASGSAGLTAYPDERGIFITLSSTRIVSAL